MCLVPWYTNSKNPVNVWTSGIYQGLLTVHTSPAPMQWALLDGIYQEVWVRIRTQTHVFQTPIHTLILEPLPHISRHLCVYRKAARLLSGHDLLCQPIVFSIV